MINFMKNNMDYFKKFILAFAVIVVYKTFDNMSAIFHSFGVVLKAFGPFFAALIIAYMLHLPAIKLSMLIKRIKNTYISRHSYGVSILIVYILTVLLCVITISSIVPALYQNVLDFTIALPNYMTQAYDKFSELDAVKRLDLQNSLPGIEQIMSSVLNILDINNIGNYIGQVFSVTSGVINVFIAVIGSIYMLLDKDRIIRNSEKFIRLIFNESRAEFIIEHSRRINVIFTKYIYCRLICSLICGTVCGIVLSIMGVKYALILALFIGAMDMIPYFGSIISCVVAIAITLITGGFWQTLWTAVALLIIQQLDGNLLAPKLMGDSLELRPLWIVIVVFVGGKLFGFLGMLLSVPIVAVLRAVASDYIGELQQKKEAAAAKEKNEEKSDKATEDAE